MKNVKGVMPAVADSLTTHHSTTHHSPFHPSFIPHPSSFPSREWTIGARWVFPVGRPPVERGMVAIRDDRIVHVEAISSKKPDLYFEGAAITPGFVNAHTHLDLTGLRGRCPPQGDFVSWLREVIGYRRQRSAEEVHADVSEGLAECIASGTTLLGDISSEGRSWPVLSAAPIRSIVFLELIGLTKERSAQAEMAALDWIQEGKATETCRRGLSPHAPYSVRAELFKAAAHEARRFEAPLAVHLAETKDELDLLSGHKGPFVPFLQELGAWDAEGLADSIETFVQSCGQTRTLLIHGNYLPRSLRLPSEFSVVYCPRTHAAFGHQCHPFRDLLRQGVRIALGTDSLASNPDLNLFAEARFLRRHFPELGGDLLLHMATLAGAEALGWDKQTGSLEPGKSADLVVMPLGSRIAADPYEGLLDSDAAPLAVLSSGRWVHGNLSVSGEG